MVIGKCVFCGNVVDVGHEHDPCPFDPNRAIPCREAVAPLHESAEEALLAHLEESLEY